ncbi:hypothetical protein C9374_000614 [Naegleria lovaniensis]|uniref:3-oxo-5-alpha-steroid 4-dehydrogenase C-terminal domain-containing protein n=1 Tax=Naegleria lovaniensis TaxID=51637 RepID=A0AA88KM06_NAELO|nr:uncharacterized protein C9374_000614 [Naegleria lovaniensis]KAG2388450.1 hypothetical protein C9374_000614 [Naegleria lovaniensis]
MMMSMLYYGLNIYWIAGIGLYSLRFFNNFFHHILQYGRFSPTIENQSSERKKNLVQKVISTLLQPLITEKLHWRCIYSIGLFFNTLSLIYIFIYYFLRNNSENKNGNFNNRNFGTINCMIVMILLYEIHLLKRCVEVFFFQPWTHPARLVGPFLFLSGVSYYICAPLSLCVSSLLIIESNSFEGHNSSYGNDMIQIAMVMAGVILFLWSCFHQYKCHAILYSLARIKNKNPEIGYQIPRGDLFEYLYCPHYFTEILMYFSLNLMIGFSQFPMLFCFSFTTLNLSYHSFETHDWYQQKFKDKLPKSRKIFLPFIV